MENKLEQDWIIETKEQIKKMHPDWSLNQLNSYFARIQQVAYAAGRFSNNQIKKQAIV